MAKDIATDLNIELITENESGRDPSTHLKEQITELNDEINKDHLNLVRQSLLLWGMLIMVKR